MNVKRFIIITTVITILASAPFILGGMILPPCYQDTFMGELPAKYDRLRSIEGKRIIIVGGSGMAFAIDSSLIEAEFTDYEAVNLGMYADLGVKAMLDLARSSLHEGDIVIFAPEQHEQTLSLYLGARSALQGLDGRWDMVSAMDKEDIGTLLGGMPLFSLEKMQYLLKGEHPKGEGIYKKASFNIYGDIESELADTNQMPELYDPDIEIRYDASMLHDDFISYLNDFSDYANKKGAEFYFAFCPANRLAIAGSSYDDPFLKDVLDVYYDCLYDRFSFPMLGDPYNSVMDAEWFFDTNFHLNQSGRTLFTRQLIRDIKAVKGIDEPTDISIPQKPIAIHMNQGTDYAADSGIDSETCHAADSEINSETDSASDAILKADKYANNTDISLVEIPADVVRIEDYAFSGCVRLKEIRFASTEPSRIIVGEHLLDGTGAVISVPEGSLSAYRTNYRFSRYASRIVERQD